MAHTSDADRYVGQPMKRREDRRLLLGTGTFVDDLRPVDALTVVFVRSPHGHARIARLDVEAARNAPRVGAVVTGDEVRHLGPTTVNRGPFPDMKIPPHPVIAEGAVHSTGVPVAAIAAETTAEAWDAAELIDVDYVTLPAAPEPEAAIAAGADGLIIEVHPDPKEAISDASQTISPDVFAETLVECRKVAKALGFTMD